MLYIIHRGFRNNDAAKEFATFNTDEWHSKTPETRRSAFPTVPHGNLLQLER